MGRKRGRQREADERREILRMLTASEMTRLRSKAQCYAAFGGSDLIAGDLLHVALCAALEGRPIWRTDQALKDYCDAIMAKQVAYGNKMRLRGRR
jgi:hypothetical protein